MDLKQIHFEYARSRSLFAAKIADYLAPGIDWRAKSILDVGCGEGGIALAFARMGANTTAVEFDADRVERLASQSLDFKLVRADARVLPFADHAFEFAILADVLEHAPEPGRVLREIGRVIRPGGKLYLGTTNRASILNVLADPHYNVPFVPLMSNRIARWYVTRLWRVSNTLNVQQYFFRERLYQSIQAARFRIQPLPVYQDKLVDGSLSIAPGRSIVRRMVRIPWIQKAAIWIAGTGTFERFVAPGFELLCTRSEEI